MTRDPVSPDAGVPPGGARVRALLPLGDRRSPFAVLVSVLLHVMAVALLVRVGVGVAVERGNPLLDFLAQQPGGGGGGGTGGSSYIALEAPPPPPEPAVQEEVEAPVVVPEVLPTVEPPVELKPVVPAPPAPDPDAQAAARARGTGGGSGGGTGTGQGPGSGSGVGPGSGGGSGGGTGGGGRLGSPPELRGLAIPPMEGIPKQLRGHTFEVTFRVDVAGRVTDLVVEPEISDRKYARRFDEVMRGYRFTPARDGDGRVVAGVTTAQVTLPEN